MAWIPLEDRLANMPKVICGPILRRVEKNQVSVFIATRVYNGTPWVLHVKSINSNKSPGAIKFSSIATTPIKLGSNLFVSVLTAKPTGNQTNLATNEIYYYDVEINGETSLQASNMVIMGVNPPIFRETLCVEAYELPSFLLPAPTINDLNIIHASCRKPHGGEGSIPTNQNQTWRDRDALAKAYNLISSNYSEPSLRPQLLFLTGDQIYADDVADIVLCAIQDAEKALMGTNYAEDTYSPSLPDPGERGEYIKSYAFKTQDPKTCKSHLVKFSEFFLMYIMTFSDILWQGCFSSTDDTFDKITNSIINKFGMSFLNEENNKDKLKAFKSELKHLGWTTSHTEIGDTGHFIKDMKYVRRTLANIATYMIFDDHEITDDWNINSRWVNNAYDNTLFGKTIIRNGLMAFELFQAWGNYPDEFKSTSSNHKDILDKIELMYKNNTGTLDTAKLNDIQTLIIPQRFQAAAGVESYLYYSGSKTTNFHFRLDFLNDPSSNDPTKNYCFYFLDTRCRRSLPIFNTNSGALISLNQQNDQLNLPTGINENGFTTIIVSPAPFLAPSIHDDMQEILLGYAFWKKKSIREDEFDFETWGANSRGFFGFIERMAKFKKVIILSGDVHYSCSINANFWILDPSTANSNNVVYNPLTILQLTASAAKNSYGSGLKGKALSTLETLMDNVSHGVNSYLAFIDTPAVMQELVTLSNKSLNKKKAIQIIDARINTVPIIGNCFKHPPTYKFTIELLGNDKTISTTVMNDFISNLPPISSGIISLKVSKKALSLLASNIFKDYGVFMDNIGNVRFSKVGTSIFVYHNLVQRLTFGSDNLNESKSFITYKKELIEVNNFFKQYHLLRPNNQFVTF